MTSFNDIVFNEEKFNFDQTPEEFNDDSFEDETNYQSKEDVRSSDEPGAGDSFQGTDPTFFDEQDQLLDEKGVPKSDQIGTDDDPERQENETEEDTGEDEIDTSDEPIDSGRNIDATDNIEYPEQGIDKQEVTYREPERIYRLDELEIVFENQSQRLLLDFDDFIDSNLPILEDNLSDEFLTGSINEIIDENLQLDFFTSPSNLFSFNDVIGSIENETFLTEFQFLFQDLD